ncbi:LemA protein [Prevotellaceae bacterium MN60]|nr:LemA protein [Prevotellaceae bacterium MN60]
MKLNKTLIAVIAAIVIICMWAASGYNSMVSEQEEATKAFADVQVTCQRRADLIPNLVKVVKGYATHEKETLEGVVDARSKALQIKINPSNMTPEKIKEFMQAQGELEKALGRLLAIKESYPDLKANTQFQTLQAQIEGSENRVNEARIKYNAAVQEYNITVRKFPKNILAGIFGFNTMDKFEAMAGAENAPEVNF